MHSLSSLLLAAFLFSATSFSAPSDEVSLAKRDYQLYQPTQGSGQQQQGPVQFASWDHGHCGRSKYLENNHHYVFQLQPWKDDGDRRILAGCWACFQNSGQSGQGWRGTAGAVMRDTLNNVQWYNKWKAHVPNPNDNLVQLSITGDGMTMYLGAGDPMRLSNGDRRAFAVTNDVTRIPYNVDLRYHLTKDCKIRFTHESKGVLGRCGDACRDWNSVVSLRTGTQVMHFWGNYDENNQHDRPERVDFTAIPYQ